MKNKIFDISQIVKPIDNTAFKLYENLQKELDKQTEDGKPSDRIKFLFTGSLCSKPKSGWIQAILDYLDEQYEKTNK